jgi:glutamate synthase domain-containing protein 2
LRAGFQPKAAALRVANFLNVTLEELKTFARVTGHARLRDLSTDDLATTNGEIAAHAGIAHA